MQLLRFVCILSMAVGSLHAAANVRGMSFFMQPVQERSHWQDALQVFGIDDLVRAYSIGEHGVFWGLPSDNALYYRKDPTSVIKQFDGVHTQPILALDVSTDARCDDLYVVTGAADGRLAAWIFNKSVEVDHLHECTPLAGEGVGLASVVAWSNTQKSEKKKQAFVVASRDWKLSLWTIQDGLIQTSDGRLTGLAAAVVWSQDDTYILVGLESGAIEIWEAATLMRRHEISAREVGVDKIHALKIRKDGALIITGIDGRQARCQLSLASASIPLEDGIKFKAQIPIDGTGPSCTFQ